MREIFWGKGTEGFNRKFVILAPTNLLCESIPFQKDSEGLKVHEVYGLIEIDLFIYHADKQQ